MYGEIKYEDREREPLTVSFVSMDWLDPSVEMYIGLKVEFNILEMTGSHGSQTRAVRVRPLEVPLTME